MAVGVEVGLDVGLGEDHAPPGVAVGDAALGHQAADEPFGQYTRVGLDRLRDGEVPAPALGLRPLRRRPQRRRLG